jgi:CO/xanthine dehydrogenase FAD-binding subunit
MRATVPLVDYYTPKTVAETVKLLTKLEKASILAGGTDYVPATRMKGFRPKNLVSLKNLGKHLRYISFKNGVIKIGTLTRMRDIEKSEVIRKHAPHLYEAAAQVGAIPIRNRATLGGNLCNASPAADTAPPLLTLDSVVEIVGPRKKRTVSIDDFFVGVGKTVLKKGEIVSGISFRPWKGGFAFMKIGRRQGEDIAIASAAVSIKMKGEKISDVKIALGSVAPTPIRARKAEADLFGKEPTKEALESAAKKAAEESSRIDDVRASADYRRKMVKVLVTSTLSQAVKKAKGDSS